MSPTARPHRPRTRSRHAAPGAASIGLPDDLRQRMARFLVEGAGA